MIKDKFFTKVGLQVLPVLTFFLCSGSLQAQKEVVKTWEDGTLKARETLDKKGFKTGECTYYHENGQLRMREFYVKGRREGTCEGWYEDGTQEFTRTYVLMQRGSGGVSGTEPVPVKDGLWIEYHDNGQKKKEEHYDKGVLQGIVRTWYEDGQLEEMKTMKDKFRDGLYERYFENGQLGSRGYYERGERSGEWMTYYENGQLAHKEAYRSDKVMDGPWRGFHPNGIDSLIGSYNNGRKEGIWEGYHDNGAMKSKINYRFGMPTGSYVEFHANGVKAVEGAFGETVRDVKRGREEGLWKEWFDNGQLQSEATYKDGKRIGPYNEWYENGFKKFETTFSLHANIITDQFEDWTFKRNKEDLMEGMTREWYEDGQLMSEGVYTKGMRDGLWKEYYPSGSLQMEAIFDKSKPSGAVTEYFENGNVRSKGYYEVAGRKKLRTGRWITYYQNGDRESEGEFIKNKRVGRWQEWYTNGNLRQDSFFEDGADQGPYKDYYENGVLRTSGQHKGIKRSKGLQHGVWKHYNESGELVLTETWYSGRIQ